MPRGGARPGSGRKPGTREAKVLERMRIAEAYNQKIMRAADKLFVAQAQLALGSMKVIRVDETKGPDGKPKREHVHVTDTEEIIALLNEHDGLPGEVDGTYYYFVDVIPDNRALDSMLNRGLGKPKETVEVQTNADAVAEAVLSKLKSSGYDDEKIAAFTKANFPELATEVVS